MAASLRKAGIRVTKQRIALMQVLAEADDHPDAFELHERARAVEPSVSLATVYRTLSTLEEGGVVHRHSFEGGGARFETTHEEHHDHILDIDSGAVIEFQSDKIEELQEAIARELGYEVVHHRLELYCRKIP
ncbi:transcriptional repressor [Sulfitobacter albidus]|uniref:Ferric uptake regulation protein n=1 Tax=Sulfitobacter albidus TaxID=2829501 RepID=A0A975PM39_9RHOB|nr:Fur family transcriptional regulator [Sulfitobacter albidus]QUJ76324.1 transcriptional repressor [Sulfitobacter albidus]